MRRIITLVLLVGLVIVVARVVDVDSPTNQPVNPSTRLKPLTLTLPDSQSPYIDDQSNILGAFKYHLHRMAKNWEDSLGIEVHVVTLDAPNEKIAVLSNTLFRERQVGKQAPTGGVLIVIETGSRQARIEVSYSLEGVFTDAIVGLLAHDQLAPYASYQVVGMAVMDVLHFLKDHALEQAVLGALELPQQYRDSKAYKNKQTLLSGGAGAKVAIPSVPTDLDFKKPLSPEAQRDYLPSDNPNETVQAFKRSLKYYIGDANLPLFTEGSQIMRAKYPFAPYESLARWRKIVASEPLRIVTKGRYAVALSDRPAHGFTPVLMKRVDNKWRVDMVETWKNLFFDPEGNYFLNNNNTAYRFGLQALGKGKFHEISPLPVGDHRLKILLQQLETVDTANAHFRRAELLFRNAFAAIEAIKHYEQAMKLAPDDPLFQSTYVDRVRYLGFPELAVPVLNKMGVSAATRLAEAFVAAGHNELAVEAAQLAVDDNPYSLYALRILKWTLEQTEQTTEAKRVGRYINKLRKRKDKRYEPVWLSFYPQSPLLRTLNPKVVKGTKVYGHSDFSVTIKNHSKRAVRILSVRLISAGTGNTSGLGDIKDYWKYKNNDRQLVQGEYRRFNKTWGFTVDPGHDRLSYLFHVCWQGEEDDLAQCNTQTLHLTTDVNTLWNGKLPFDGGELEGLWYESDRKNSRWVLDIRKTGTGYEGRYAQLSGKNIRFNEGELVLKAAFNDEGKLEGQVLIKYFDEIKAQCTNAQDRWVPIELSISHENTRLSGRWQATNINPKKDCREKKARKMSYVLDRLKVIHSGNKTGQF